MRPDDYDHEKKENGEGKEDEENEEKKQETSVAGEKPKDDSKAITGQIDVTGSMKIKQLKTKI